MAGQISAIKKRVQTVNSTKKLTNATELVATVKLQKYNVKSAQNEEYAKNLKRFISGALKGSRPEVETNPYLIKHDIENPLYIIITSNSGLCGSYNLEVLKFVEENVSKDVPIFAIGTIGYNYLMKNNYLVVKKYDAKMLGLSDVVQPDSTTTVYDYIRSTLGEQKVMQYYTVAAQEIAVGLDTADNVERKKTGDALTKLLSW